MLTGVDKQTGERLDDVNIRYQVITFLIASHETTSGLLSFATYFLLKNPDVLAKAYDEVDRVLGGDLSVPPTYQQVKQLQYISQVLKETLRLWPSVPAFSRHAYEDTVLGGKYQVTKQDQLMILERVMNLAEKPHQNADSSVSSALRRSPVFRISKPLLSKSITASKPHAPPQPEDLER